MRQQGKLGARLEEPPPQLIGLLHHDLPRPCIKDDVAGPIACRIGSHCRVDHTDGGLQEGLHLTNFHGLRLGWHLGAKDPDQLAILLDAGG